MAAGQSRPIDRILNILVSAAAVPVLLGALFKITHAPGADTWLKIGLYVEAGIFLGYALLYVFSPPPEAPMATAAPVETGNPALKSMDKMLQEADITPTNLKKLSEGFQKLMQFQIERAQQFYQQALHQLPPADRKAQRTGLIMAAIYRATLNEIADSGCHVLKERISLTPLRKFWLAWKTWIKS